MLPTIHTINLLLPFFYISTFAIYFYDFQQGGKKFENSKRLFLFLTLIFHFLYLLLRTIEFNHPPITNVFEIFTVLAFAISFSYFILELVTDITWYRSIYNYHLNYFSNHINFIYSRPNRSKRSFKK